MSNKVQGVYAIKGPSGMYIGSSLNIHTRWSVHLSTLKRGIHKNYKLQSAYNKHGRTSFELVVLEVVAGTRQEAMAREQYYINTLRPRYNILTETVRSGTQGKRASEETKRKLREAWERRRADPEAMARVRAAARTRCALTPEEARVKSDKLSKAHTGKKHSATHIANRAATRRGTKHSEETKQKMKESLKLRKPPSTKTRELISKAHKGRVKSELERARLGAAVRKAWKEGRMKPVTKHTPETLAKMSIASKGHVVTKEQRAKISAGLKRAWAEGRLHKLPTRKKEEQL